MKGVFNVVGYAAFCACAVIAVLATLLFGGIGAIPLAIPLAILLFFTFAGAQARALKAEKIVQTTLMKGEQLVAQTLQHRAYALWKRRDVLAITNSRILIIQRGLLGGFKMMDIQWKDLQDATIEQNVLDSICGSNLQFAHLNEGVPPMSVEGVKSDAASLIYAHAQAEEQAWEEKRRVRAMEEVRAAAGGVVVHTPQPQAAAPQATAGGRMLTEIQEAKRLLDAGVISDAEFQEMKSKILASA
jgi:hypothetical protein